jgi:hypothetical protein
MKVRKGFVSNSSSSSFMAIFDSKLVPEIMESLDPAMTAFFEQVDVSREKLEDREVVIYYTESGERSYLEYSFDREKFVDTVVALSKISGTPSDFDGFEDKLPEIREIDWASEEAGAKIEKMFVDLQKERKCIVITRSY